MSGMVICNVCGELVTHVDASGFTHAIYKTTETEAPHTCIDCREEANLMVRLHARLAAAEKLAEAVRVYFAGRGDGHTMYEGHPAIPVRAALAEYEEAKQA